MVTLGEVLASDERTFGEKPSNANLMKLLWSVSVL